MGIAALVPGHVSFGRVDMLLHKAEQLGLQLGRHAGRVRSPFPLPSAPQRRTLAGAAKPRCSDADPELFQTFAHGALAALEDPAQGAHIIVADGDHPAVEVAPL